MRLEAAIVLLLLGLPACGPAAERPAPMAGEEGDAERDALGAAVPDASPGPDDAGPEASSPAVCVEGSQRGCKITLPSHGQVNNCFVGVETCTDGQWGPCDAEPIPE